MVRLDLNKEKNITEVLEYLLLPMNGAVKKFEECIEMTCRSRRGNEEWRERVEIICPVVINTDFGEKNLSILCSNPSLIGNVSQSVHEFLYDYGFPANIKNDILNRLYSPETKEVLNGLLME